MSCMVLLRARSSDRAFLGFFGHGVEHLEQDLVGIDSFGLGLEVEQDAVAKARPGRPAAGLRSSR